MRPDGHEHFLAVGSENNIPRPMPPTAQTSATRDIGHNHFFWAARRQVAVLIREANNRVRISDVKISRIGPWRIKRKTERLAKVLGKYGGARDLAIRSLTQHLYPTRSAFN